MADDGQMIVVGIRLELAHLLDGESDVGNAALDLRQSADIELARLGHHRRVGRQVMLNADSHVAARSKHVGQERVLGELDGVAVVEDSDRQLDHAGFGLHLPVATHGDIDLDQPVAAGGIV